MEIKRKNREIEKNYQIELLREKEDEIHHLKKIENELRIEKQTLARIREDQDKILKQHYNPEDNMKRKELLEKVRELKEKYKVLIEEKNKKEKQVYAFHSNVIDEKSALRDMMQKLQETKNTAEISETPEEI